MFQKSSYKNRPIIITQGGQNPLSYYIKDLNIDDLISVSEEQNSQEQCNSEAEQNCLKKEL
jgi:hypothetical protein